MTEKSAIYSALAEITGELAKIGISKNNKNQQQGYKFRGIDDIYNTLSGLLSKYHVIIIPAVRSREQTERVTGKGGTLFYTTVCVDYSIFSAEDGSSVQATTYGEAMDSADKSTNKAMSAAYKYLCLQLFCIPTEGDNDADATTPEDNRPKQAVAPGPSQREPVPSKQEPPQKTLAERFDDWIKFLSAKPDKSLNLADEKTATIITRVQDVLDELQTAGRAKEYKQLNDLINAKLIKAA